MEAQGTVWFRMLLIFFSQLSFLSNLRWTPSWKCSTNISVSLDTELSKQMLWFRLIHILECCSCKRIATRDSLWADHAIITILLNHLLLVCFPQTGKVTLLACIFIVIMYLAIFVALSLTSLLSHCLLIISNNPFVFDTG
jgi:hypothetical protein